MIKRILFSIAFSLAAIATFSQTSVNKILFIIDSVPLFNDPEAWNPILPEDIADMKTFTYKDSLQLLGWDKFDGVTYVFTKEYRSRPDSLKKIPRMKQLEMKEDSWNFQGGPYTGKYIDYYNNGRKQDEGTLLNGRLHGAVTVYFQNGNIKSVSNFKDGILDGVVNEYYKTGILNWSREFVQGKDNNHWQMYFPNGRMKTKFIKGDRYDTSLAYYSTGQIKEMVILKNGTPVADNRREELYYLNAHYYDRLNRGYIKEAKKFSAKLFELDPANADVYYKRGVISFREFRFDEAITDFDKALSIEPQMAEAFSDRAWARITKYRLIHEPALSKKNINYEASLQDIMAIPTEVQEKICSDFQQAEELGMNDNFFTRLRPLPSILDFCRKKSL